MPFLHSVATGFPPHYYDQERLIEALKSYWVKNFYNPQRLEEFQRNVAVGGRHLALEIEDYRNLEGFEDRNNAWLREGLNLSEKVVQDLLTKADLPPESVHCLISNTVTGIAVPSLEARLMNRIPFSRRTKRIPLMGLGCLAGVAGINRAADYLVGHPKECVIFFSVELCSLTIQFHDLSIPNIISTGLFGDGAAAVLMVGDEHPLASDAPFQWIGSQSAFFPESERVMGWDITNTGFKIVLGKEVPEFSFHYVPAEVASFLSSFQLTQQDISYYWVHPGGPKVLMSMEQALNLRREDLYYSWQGLRDHGNMSSVSVLFVLQEYFKTLPPYGSFGLMLSMGPAFCAELGLVQCKHGQV